MPYGPNIRGLPFDPSGGYNSNLPNEFNNYRPAPFTPADFNNASPGGTPQYFPFQTFPNQSQGGESFTQNVMNTAANQRSYGGGQQYYNSEPQYQPTPDQFIGPGQIPQTRGGQGINPAALMAGQVSQGYNQAKLANELRYKQILQGYGGIMNQYKQGMGNLLGGYQQRYQQGIGAFDQWGKYGMQEIANRGQQQQAQGQQGLINSGLGNSTVMGSMQKGVQKQTDYDQGMLAAQLAMQKGQFSSQLQGDYLNAQQQGIGNLANMGQQKLGFMERRNDSYPNMAQIGPMMQQYGQGMGALQNARMLAQQRAMGGGYGGGYDGGYY